MPRHGVCWHLDREIGRDRELSLGHRSTLFSIKRLHSTRARLLQCGVESLLEFLYSQLLDFYEPPHLATRSVCCYMRARVMLKPAPCIHLVKSLAINLSWP